MWNISDIYAPMADVQVPYVNFLSAGLPVVILRGLRMRIVCLAPALSEFCVAVRLGAYVGGVSVS